MMQDPALFTPGTIVQHFKRTTATEDVLSEHPLLYLYEIVGTAMDTESEEEVMVYRALYGDRKLYVRPLSMFLSPVDREKYPALAQDYRFVPVHP